MMESYTRRRIVLSPPFPLVMTSSNSSIDHQHADCSAARSPRSRTSALMTSGCVVVILLVVFSFQWQVTEAIGCDDKCHNGGRMLMPSNVFGVCRCKCSSAFFGPRCQFSMRKRGGDQVALPPLLHHLALLPPYSPSTFSSHASPSHSPVARRDEILAAILQQQRKNDITRQMAEEEDTEENGDDEEADS
jgi:hypothetical protein